ncbi:MAG: hypothetical protein ACK55I_42620, partial [bacterium]
MRLDFHRHVFDRIAGRFVANLLRIDLVPLQTTILESYDPLGPLGYLVFVRDQDDRAAFVVESFKGLQNLLGGPR